VEHEVETADLEARECLIALGGEEARLISMFVADTV